MPASRSELQLSPSSLKIAIKLLLKIYQIRLYLQKINHRKLDILILGQPALLERLLDFQAAEITFLPSYQSILIMVWGVNINQIGLMISELLFLMHDFELKKLLERLGTSRNLQIC